MSMVSYGPFFQCGSIAWHIDCPDKFEAIRRIVHQSRVFEEIDGLDPDEFADIVIAREKIQSTALGHGVAVAHGRSVKVRHPLVALGISHDGIAFDAPDGAPVHLIFVVANHPSQQVDYLAILSTLARLVHNSGFRNALLHATGGIEAEHIFGEAFQKRIGARYEDVGMTPALTGHA
ncbi:MAG: PTS sugar transporter subunit IIA [Spirochaetaceae bacterium]